MSFNSHKGIFFLHCFTKFLFFFSLLQVEFDPKQRRDQQHHRMPYEEDDRYDEGPRVQQCTTN